MPEETAELHRLATAPGCFYTIEQLASSGVHRTTTWPMFGRAHLLKKAWCGTRVVVCEVRSADSSVVCHENRFTGAVVRRLTLDYEARRSVSGPASPASS